MAQDAQSTDKLSRAERSEHMKRIRGRDTGPELAVRRLLTSLGVRYRLQYTKLPGRPDIAMPGRRKVVLVHGCFWHRHEGCDLARLPKSRRAFWVPKLERNRERDQENQGALEELGWESLAIWECELRDEAEVRSRLSEFVLDCRCTPLTSR